MECGEVSPGTLVAGGHLLVDRRKECAGSTGEVADAETADGPGVGPVNPLQLGHGQPRQQGGGLGAGVEGGEVFAVCDEPLEDAPCEVVGLAPRTASTWMKLAGMDLTAEDVTDRGGINAAARGVN